MIALAAASTLAVVLGTLQMPFGYYTLLRVTLCLSSAVGIAAARRRGDDLWMWIYGSLAVVYNPILPLELGSKSLWIGLNIISLPVLWLGAARFRGVMSMSLYEGQIRVGVNPRPAICEAPTPEARAPAVRAMEPHRQSYFTIDPPKQAELVNNYMKNRARLEQAAREGLQEVDEIDLEALERQRSRIEAKVQADPEVQSAIEQLMKDMDEIRSRHIEARPAAPAPPQLPTVDLRPAHGRNLDCEADVFPRCEHQAVWRKNGVLLCEDHARAE